MAVTYPNTLWVDSCTKEGSLPAIHLLLGLTGQLQLPVVLVNIPDRRIHILLFSLATQRPAHIWQRCQWLGNPPVILRQTLGPLLGTSWWPCKRNFFFFNQVCFQINCMFPQGLKKIPFSILLAAGLLHPSQVLWLSLVTHQEHFDYKYISQPQADWGNHTKRLKG